MGLNQGAGNKVMQLGVDTQRHACDETHEGVQAEVSEEAHVDSFF